MHYAGQDCRIETPTDQPIEPELTMDLRKEVEEVPMRQTHYVDIDLRKSPQASEPVFIPTEPFDYSATPG